MILLPVHITYSVGDRWINAHGALKEILTVQKPGIRRKSGLGVNPGFRRVRLATNSLLHVRPQLESLLSLTRESILECIEVIYGKMWMMLASSTGYNCRYQMLVTSGTVG
jgi:hypothetical protein